MSNAAATPKPVKHHCDCGRGFTTASGAKHHYAVCPIERARSIAFVDALENGGNPWTAGAAAVRQALAR